MILAIVSARAGSKGLPGKNTRALAGKPLIAHTIEAARRAPSVSRVLVSTDGQDIADVAKSYGADVPFLRPSELARDETPGIEPVLHAVHWLAEQEASRPELILLLQPTSPLRTAEDIEAAVALMKRSHPPAVVSVEPVRKYPQWMVTLADDGQFRWMMGEDAVATRRQDLPTAYALNGAIYLVRREVLVEQRTLLPRGTIGYVMPPERSVDIDSELDIRVAEALLRERSK